MAVYQARTLSTENLVHKRSKSRIIANPLLSIRRTGPKRLLSAGSLAVSFMRK